MHQQIFAESLKATADGDLATWDPSFVAPGEDVGEQWMAVVDALGPLPDPTRLRPLLLNAPECVRRDPAHRYHALWQDLAADCGVPRVVSDSVGDA